ncbi:MAG: hypothetical protein HC789_21850 [Microcoleus sp. CSU_2_2]|nr:hypothetical protein [Microcoleus sp. SU_5_3]NJS12827.1 hypothetical protein [Microcoleus sp. CSU_2_2]
MNSEKHVWTQWHQLNKKLKCSGMVNRRHDYRTVSNWSFLATPLTEEAQALGKSIRHLVKRISCCSIDVGVKHLGDSLCPQPS